MVNSEWQIVNDSLVTNATNFHEKGCSCRFVSFVTRHLLLVNQLVNVAGWTGGMEIDHEFVSMSGVECVGAMTADHSGCGC